MAQRHDEITAAGARVVAISVDTPEQHAAIIEKLDLRFPLLSDPDRSGAITPYGLADPKDERSIALAALVVVTPGGDEVYRRVSVDYADRPSEDDIVERLRGLGLPPTTQDLPDTGPAQAGPGAKTLEQLLPYYRGARFAVVAMGRRHPDIRETADTYIAQLDRHSAAAQAVYRAKRNE